MALSNSLLLALALFLTSVAPGAAQGSPAQECDRLAAETDGAGNPAVPLAAIDAEAALAACAAALEAQPADLRLTYQYGRALERAGRLEDARRLYAWAAAGGHVAAEAALQRLSPAGDATRAAAAATPAAEQNRQVSESYAGLAAALRRYAATLPQDPSDPLTVLAAIGSDPETIFRWVSENTRLVAYRGSLRGARGVLLDRAGNSLDRALLLAALLRGAGQEVRLAHAMLTDDQARALLPATERRVTVPKLPPPMRDDLVALFADDPRVDPDLIDQAADATIAGEATAATAMVDSVATLLPAVSEAAVRAAAPDADARTAALVALRDHYWVQLRTAAGWRDLGLDGDAPGPLQAIEILDPTKLPAELRHTVVLRVIVELQDDAGRREEKLLEWSVAPADLIDQPVVFSNIPRALATIDQVLTASNYRQRMFEALDQETAWVPVIEVGGSPVTDKMFTRDGVVQPANLNDFFATGGAVSAVTGAAEVQLGAHQDPPPKPAIPTAEWLEVEVRVPGAEPVTQRRTIFDLVGPAARASGAAVTISPASLRDRALRLLGQSDILIIGASPSEIQVARIAARDLAVIADNMHAVTAAPPDLDNLPVSPELPLALYQFASRRLGADAAPTLASPNVFMLHRRLSLGNGLTVKGEAEFDIVENTVAAPRDPFLARLRQGIMDTVAESQALSAPEPIGNAALIHLDDLTAGRPWARLDLDGIARLKDDASSADARARIESDLEAGFIVVAPADIPAAAAAQRLAWWRIDPRTGTTLGMMPDGGGTAMAEYGHTIFHIAHKAACAYGLLSATMSGGEGGLLGATGLALCTVAAGTGGVAFRAGVIGLAVHAFELYHKAHEGAGH